MSQQQQASDPLTKLRAACLSRGASGIKGFVRMFRIYDDNRNGKLCVEEFTEGLHDYGIRDLTKREVDDLFMYFDKDGSGQINLDELLISIRPPMNKSRTSLIDAAFNKMDVTGDGTITDEDLGKYNVQHHPKYLSGEWTRKQVLQTFLNEFEPGEKKDGRITKEEFFNYYAAISANIDKDIMFDLMMRQCWKL